MQEILNILQPAIGKHTLDAKEIEAFGNALTLLERNQLYLPFCKDARRFKDYTRRIADLVNLLIKAEKKGLLGVMPSEPVKRHVGRPTKVEQVAYAEQQKAKALAEAKASLFPEVKPDLSVRPLTYNGIVANPNGESIAATMPHLMQIRQFLSVELQERVNAVRDLRNEMASKAEQAKTMAEANERATVTNGSPLVYSEEEIATLATRAVEIESDILPAIYNAVDREMGEIYLRLSQRTGDPELIKKYEKDFSVPTQDLRTQFKPFYEKAQERDPRFSAMVAEKIANDRPEVKAQRDAAAKHKAEADAIIKYIIRKDKPSTKARVKGLAERIGKLRKDYGDIVTEDEIKGYEAILAKTEEELSANNPKKK